MEARKKAISAISAISAKTNSGTKCHKCHTPLGVALAPDNDTFTITLKAVKGWHMQPIQRLRGLLKASLRGWGFRCTNITTKP
jgi:hypothetical protein